MKKLTLLVLLVSFGLLNTNSQTIELTFTAVNNTNWIQLDSIKVMNRTQGTDTVLYWPDTVLVFDYQSGITEYNNVVNSLKVSQNFPNPVINHTFISLFIPDKGKTWILISDMLGRTLLKSEWLLESGYHTFRFIPGNSDFFVLTAYNETSSQSIKIVNHNNNSHFKGSLEYVGGKNIETSLKKKLIRQAISYNPGDTMIYVGYIGTIHTGILSVPETNSNYVFQCAHNITCLDIPTVNYEGKEYNTIQILSQCWLKENLNVGSLINGNQTMTDNSIIEKYCYNNQEVLCGIYGGLYQWNEVMQYKTTLGDRGICPPGWHVPTDDEWKILEGAVDSQYSFADTEWEEWQARGFDVGNNLKSTNGWNGELDGDDLFGFTALPGGYLYKQQADLFLSSGDRGYYWSSTEFEYEGSTDYSAFRMLGEWNPDQSERWVWEKSSGYSVRCLKD